MEEVLIWAMCGQLMVQTTLCLIIWYKCELSVKKDDKGASLSPKKAYKERKAKKEANKELDIVETILANISNYDGTSNNQRDVPRG